jgi:hypothetical protein
LKPGDLVIVNGLQRVRPGMQVETEQTVATLPSPGQALAAR